MRPVPRPPVLPPAAARRSSRPGPLVLGAALSVLIAGGCGDSGRPGSEASAAAPGGASAVRDTLLPVAGTRLFVHQEGRGDPVLIVHGGPLLDHGYLEPWLRPLADGYRLVYFDQRLSGRSAGRVDSASVRLDTLVADIDAVRTALGLERVHVLGHSWGGLLAARYAIEHPRRVRSLTLVSPMAPTAELWRREQQAVQAALEPADTVGLGALRSSEGVAAGEPAALERLLRLTFRSELSDPRLADSLRFHVPADYGERSRQFARLMPDLVSYDITEGLNSLAIPTLVVYGAEEAGARIGADTLRALLPRGEVELVAGAGHFAFLEQPEAFLSRLRSFLATTGRR